MYGWNYKIHQRLLLQSEISTFALSNRGGPTKKESYNDCKLNHVWPPITRFLQRFIKICYKGRKNFADIWPLAPVPVVYIEVKNGIKTFFQRDLLEKTHILLFFSTRFLPFVHSLKKHLLK